MVKVVTADFVIIEVHCNSKAYNTKEAPVTLFVHNYY